MSYNGWKNYETWAVNLYIDNDYNSHLYWREITREVYNSSEPTEHLSLYTAARWNLAARLRDEILDANPLADHGTLFSCLLGAALDEVDWVEIADNWLAGEFSEYKSLKDERSEV